MAWAAVRESVTLPGRADRARVARAFVDTVLGPFLPHTLKGAHLVLRIGPATSGRAAPRLPDSLGYRCA
jgi:hypothetical protein